MAAQLGLDARAPSLARLAALEPAGDQFLLPGPAELAERLDQLGVAVDARVEIVAGRPSPSETPAAWWLLTRLHQELLTHPGIGYPPPWPAPPPGDDALSRYFHVYVFLGAFGAVRRFHAERGIPDEISWATLGDVGASVERHRRETGRPGFANAAWIWHHFRGELYRLGRLQFNRWYVEFEPGPAAPGRVRSGAPAIGVHIPRGGGLEPAACDDALARARRFFPRYFPEHPADMATCSSWLLDPRLAEHLTPDTNIVRFQRRFTLGAERWPGDEDVLRFVFGRGPDVALDELRRTTTLERVVADHLAAGGHWEVRHGWLTL